MSESAREREVNTPLFDVIAVEIKAPHAERSMKTGLTEENAEAFIKMAIYRRGVDTEFYIARAALKLAESN